MREAARPLIRAVDLLVPADARAKLRALPGELARRLPVWRQQCLLLEGEEVAPFNVGFAGYSARLPNLTDLLRLSTTPRTRRLALGALFQPATALFCDWPVPGALRVPVLLRTFVRLERTMEETMAGLEGELRRRMRRLAERSAMVQVTDPGEAVRIHREMMAPFARVRHDDRAEIVPEPELVRLAREDFLGVVLLDGHVVASQSCFTYQRHRERCWAALRFGYPEPIYSDPHRLADANTLNAYCAVQHALDTGHQVFDFGVSAAAPEGGLLQFKRRRGGFVSSFGCPFPLWLRPPTPGADAFFWRWPLFSIEPGGLRLHVGIPEGVSDEKVLARLRTIAFGGIESVRLHAGRAISPPLRAAAAEIFKNPRGAIHGRDCAPWLEVSRCP